MKPNFFLLKRRLNPVVLILLMTTSIISYAAPPTTPLGFRFEVYSETTAELFWQRSSGNPFVIGYELTKNGEILGVFDTLSYVDHTLTGGTPYEYTVTAINTQGERSQTVSVTLRVPSSPAEQIALLQQEIADLQNQLTQSTTTLVAATGQTTSYFPGDDGDGQFGAQASTERYVVNGDGTFTDSLTRLIWIADGDCIPSTVWVDALEYANALTGDGSSSCTSLRDGSAVGDWRLANIVELQSLYNYGLSMAIRNVPLTNLEEVTRDDFWSSTSFQSAPSPNDIGLAWEVQFSTVAETGGHIDQKSRLGRAWAVRNME